MPAESHLKNKKDYKHEARKGGKSGQLFWRAARCRRRETSNDWKKETRIFQPLEDFGTPGKNPHGWT